MTKEHDANRRTLELAFHMLALAVVIIACMLAFSALHPHGETALRTIGGMRPDQLPDVDMFRWALLLDLSFPMIYGTGVIALIIGTGGRSVLVLPAVLFALFGVLFDLAENATLTARFLHGSAAMDATYVLTIWKYCSLSVAGIMLTAFLPRVGLVDQLVLVVLRFVAPLLVAFALSGLFAPVGEIGLSLLLVVAIVGLALIAKRLAGTAHKLD